MRPIALVWMLLVPMIGSSLCSADGPRRPWLTSRISGTPHPPAPYALELAFANLKFDKPTSLTQLPGERMLLTEIGGRIVTFAADPSTAQAHPLMELPGSRVLHATVHPEFSDNGRMFVCYTKAGTTYVSRFDVDRSSWTADADQPSVLLTWPAGGHNAGCLGFGTDGMLYVATGDGSGPNPPDGRTAAQDVTNLFGCILRIDVDRKESGREYAVPPDNPFVDHDQARREIWAYGLRNPWKFGIDRATGDMFVADNGWETWETVHKVVRGGNCGWPIMEGRAILRSEVEPGPTPIRPPVKDHPHTEANSVIGGPVYRGNRFPDLVGTFIYGDYITGTIWGLNADEAGEYSSRTLVDTDQRITAFAQTSAGDILVVDYDYTGQIYRLVPSQVEDKSDQFPRRLSETGLFESLRDLKPAAGVVPFDVTAKRWMDGADAQRWVAIPGDQMIRLAESANSTAEYPDGTVLVKHLSLPRDGVPSGRPLETQILHYQQGVWRPYSYLWDERGSDATLVDSVGVEHEIPDGDAARTWRVSAENECRLCHNAGSGYVLGFEVNQLNRSDQLNDLASTRVIAEAPLPATTDPGRLVDPHDASQSIEDRARSYLHANCSACHHPGGSAIVSIYLRRDLPFERLRTGKPPGVGSFGLQDSKIIVPGDPFRSILLYRMAKLGYARMPYIGSRVVDSNGVALVGRWIAGMKPSGDDRNQPTEELLRTSNGALQLAAAIHAGHIDPDHARQGYASTSSDIRGLFETFIPESDRRKTLGRTIDPQSILSLEGDAGRGKLIFYSDGARCQACHDMRDATKSTGPTLVEIRKKYPRRNEMLQHIIDPSLKVDDKFASWVVLDVSGQVQTGLLIRDSDQGVVLKTADRRTVQIPKADIDQMTKSRQSLMPSGVLSDLTAQEAADLIAWLRSE